ncbi:MAG: SDR family oxidoreductase [Verrucomicrobiae bacterium]|nr:SDR family oxidoreductase [Verrucomicrobiae bacterium]MCP5521100.1 SDR family oxidoreductase [Verrucomicrobiales bacterium]
MTASPADASGRVLITGAAGGLGRALVDAFLEAGYRVAAGWHVTPFAQPAAPVGDRLHALPLDVTRTDSVEAAVASVHALWGGVDVLVNNAGSTVDKALWELPPEHWDVLLDTNLKGAFRCSRACVAGMVERGWGHLIHLTSHAGLRGGRGQAGYAAAKAGLIGLTHSLAAELGPSGVQVNAVLPGVLPTRMTEGLREPVLTGLRESNVLGRFGEVAEVARFVVVLAGMRHVSGQVFALDGRPLRPW